DGGGGDGWRVARRRAHPRRAPDLHRSGRHPQL
ncbi:hypothetical protein AVDCRST_MAG82-1899, partial [uncultured Rubrobacteraceae bacterium]